MLKKLLESLIGDGESPFLKSISRCLDTNHLDLVRTCLITVTWLSSSLSMLFSAGLHLPAFLSIISQLKGILENGELELKTLASLSLLNFSKISGSPSSALLFFVAKNLAIFGMNLCENKVHSRLSFFPQFYIYIYAGMILSPFFFSYSI